MKKCFISTMLMLVFVVSLIPATTAYARDNIRVVVGGGSSLINFQGQQPTIVNGRTLVPVRGVFERLEFDVSWNQNTNQVTLTGSDTIIITIGSSTFTVNGTRHNLEVPAQIINGSTMLPLRNIVESIGYILDWYEDTRIIHIWYPEPGAMDPYRIFEFGDFGLDYILDLGLEISRAPYTLAMNNAIYAVLNAWDDELNRVYGMLMQSLSPAEQNVLRQEQREWIVRRDIAAYEAGEEFRGGSFEATERMSSMINFTRARTLELMGLLHWGTAAQ